MKKFFVKLWHNIKLFFSGMWASMRDSSLGILFVPLLILIVLLILLCVPIELDHDTNENVSSVVNTTNLSQVYGGKNLASPDLTGKEYLGDGVYLLDELSSLTLTYNVYNGYFTYNGDNSHLWQNMDTDFQLSPLSTKTLQYIYVSGSRTGNLGVTFGTMNQLGVIDFNSTKEVDNMRIWAEIGSTYNQFTFKLQIEKGSTATDYKVPKEALAQHEQNIFIEGFDNVIPFNTTIDMLTPFEYGVNNFDLMAHRHRFSNYGLEMTDYWLGEILDMASWRFYSRPIKYVLNLAYADKVNYIIYDIRDTYFSPNRISNYLLEGDFERIEITVSPSNFVTFELYDKYRNVIYELNSDNDLELMQNLDVAVLLRETQTGFENGFDNGFKRGKDEGYKKGYDIGDNKGYLRGLEEKDAYGFSTLLSAIFIGLGSFLSINILPNISIGAIIAVPIVFGIIYFIIGRRKGD